MGLGSEKYASQKIMNTLAISRSTSNNVGDRVSSPCLYFDFNATHHEVKKQVPHGDLYIFGGGAIVNDSIQQDVHGTKVAWGIGQSLDHPATTIPLEGFELIGTRDIGVEGTEWVPCASCMSPLFDKEYEIKHTTVAYWNSIKYSRPDMPYLTNRATFEEAIEFLGSAEIVLTNSYHGAYWATLLGRAAVICNPYSYKFKQYKHQPAMENEKPIVYPEALAECRGANVEFEKKVRWLKTHY